jgi:hypothetical protein
MVFTNHPLKLLCPECSPYVNLSLSACDNSLKQTGVRFIVIVQSCKWPLKNFRISWSWRIQGWGMVISKRFREQISCWKHHWHPFTQNFTVSFFECSAFSHVKLGDSNGQSRNMVATYRGAAASALFRLPPMNVVNTTWPAGALSGNIDDENSVPAQDTQVLVSTCATLPRPPNVTAHEEWNWFLTEYYLSDNCAG